MSQSLEIPFLRSALQGGRDALLSQSRSAFAPLAALSSLRVGNDGAYHHAGLAERLSEELLSPYLAKLHVEVFHMWLRTPLEKQRDDVEEHVRNSGFPLTQETSANLFCRYVPDSAELPERQLFEADLSIVLRLLKTECVDPNTSRYSIGWRLAEVLQTSKISGGNVKLRLHRLGRTLGVSPNHLGRVFREQIGISYHEYLLAARMCWAAYLLSSRRMSIKETADTLGYHDTSHFHRDFRKSFGKSISEYRLRSAVDNFY